MMWVYWKNNFPPIDDPLSTLVPSMLSFTHKYRISNGNINLPHDGYHLSLRLIIKIVINTMTISNFSHIVYDRNFSLLNSSFKTRRELGDDGSVLDSKTWQNNLLIEFVVKKIFFFIILDLTRACLLPKFILEIHLEPEII